MKKISQSKFFVEGMLLAATFFWGMSFIWMKDVTNVGMNSDAAMSIRYWIAVAVMLPVVWKQLIKIGKREIMQGCILGALLWIAMTAQTEGLRYTTPASSAFITTSYVMLVPFTSWVILKHRPQKKIYLSVLICVIGLYVLTMEPGEVIGMNLGNALTLVCAVCWSIQVAYIAKAGQTMSSSMLAFLPMLFSAIAATISALISNGFNFEPGQFKTALVPLFFCAIFPTIGAGAAQAYAQKRIDPTKAALIYTLESVFACLMSIVLGYESFTAALALGGGLIVIAILLAETDFTAMARKRRAQDESKTL